MDFNTHVKTLNKFAQEFDIQMKNFNFHTDIYNLNNKSLKLNDEENNVEIRTYDINWDNTFKPDPNNFSDLFEFIKNKKLKRKHLLKKIHPDKINFLITKIKSKSNIPNINWDFEIDIISKCVGKIISENLGIMDGLKLLHIQTKLFDFICGDIGFNLEHIDQLKLYFNTTTQTQTQTQTNSNPSPSPSELDDLDVCFESLFSNDIINFVDTFNALSFIKSFPNQIKIIFDSIYTQINEYITKKIIQPIEKIHLEYENINRQKKSCFDLNLKYNDYNDNIYGNFKEKRKNEYDILTEQLDMYKEEFRIQLMIYENILGNDDNVGTMSSLLEQYKFLSTNSDFYEYLDELEKKLPIFYEEIMGLKLKKYYSFIELPWSHELDFSQIAKAEIDRIKYRV